MIITQDKDALLDYAFDWTAWLAGGETVTTAVVTVPAGLTKDRAETVTTGGLVTVWVKGGTPGSTYRLGCRVTTNQGRIDERSITIRIIER